jgi:hypothetical protein
MSDRTACVCGHTAFDHLGQGRCNEGSKRCRCPAFRACGHPAWKPWTTSGGTRWVCKVCDHVQDMLPGCGFCGGNGWVHAADVYRKVGEDAKPCWETAALVPCPQCAREAS